MLPSAFSWRAPLDASESAGAKSSWPASSFASFDPLPKRSTDDDQDARTPPPGKSEGWSDPSDRVALPARPRARDRLPAGLQETGVEPARTRFEADRRADGSATRAGAE